MNYGADVDADEPMDDVWRFRRKRLQSRDGVKRKKKRKRLLFSVANRSRYMYYTKKGGIIRAPVLQ
jgi:hypothetical protein